MLGCLQKLRGWGYLYDGKMPLTHKWNQWLKTKNELRYEPEGSRHSNLLELLGTIRGNILMRFKRDRERKRDVEGVVEGKKL